MDDPEPIDAHQEPRPVRKRKRTAHACEPCRQRKSRCDGSRPVCDLCKEQGVECYYRDSAITPATKVDRQPLEQLQARLRDMEQMLHRLVSASSREPVPSPTSTQNDAREEAAHPISVGTEGGDAVNEARANLAAGPDEFARPSDFEDSVDGMGSITFRGETSSGVFGTK